MHLMLKCCWSLCQAKSQFKRRSTANNVEIVVPVPVDADSPKFKTTCGSCKYTPENNSVIWTIKSFPGGKDFLMRAHFGLPSVQADDAEGRPPIHVRFRFHTSPSPDPGNCSILHCLSDIQVTVPCSTVSSIQVTVPCFTVSSIQVTVPHPGLNWLDDYCRPLNPFP